MTSKQYPHVDLCAGGLIYFRNHLKQPRRSPAVKKSWPGLCGTWSLHCMFSHGRKSFSRIMHPAQTLNGSLPPLSAFRS